jgi:hypothetical protein
VTGHTATITDAATERRWNEWQTRGAEADRRTATRMRTLMFVVATALAIWLAVQLA